MACLDIGGWDPECKVASDEAREAGRKRKQDTRGLKTMLRGLDFVLKVVGSHGRL